MTSPGLSEKPIVGYSDPLSVGPGEPIRFMVSTSAESFHASIVRLRHGDPAPDGPGPRYHEVASAIEGTYAGRDQPLRLGSCVAVDHAASLEPTGGLTLQAWIYPTAPGPGAQGIITKWSERDHAGYGLFLTADGAVSLRLNDETYSCRNALRPFEWAFVAASWDATSGLIVIEQAPLANVPGDAAAQRLSVAAPKGALAASGAAVVLAGHTADEGPIGRYNGKIDSPRLYGRALTQAELRALAAGESPQSIPGLLAEWDLASDADGSVISDSSGAGHDGHVVNHPMRGVTGHNWTGNESTFWRAPAEYNAAHFHEDDLEDAAWESAFTFVPSDDLPSGVYAARVSADGAEDWIPFFVRPRKGSASARVAFLAPTLSYLAYANTHSIADAVLATAGVDDVYDRYQPEDRYAAAVPVSGLYDHHPDRSGVCYSSWRRPIVTMRPNYRPPLLDAAHQLSADLHLLDWLEQKNIGYDVVTDHDLHADGVELLKPYKVIVSGTHPEYWTGAMLDALERYLNSGGRLMYVGGNGFYWVTTVSPTRPHVIEVRRGRRGTGSWRSEPGEDHHSTTGELGGLWRDRGRPPQRLVGVGMAAQGFDGALGYRREAASYGEHVSWIFDGVDAEEIGGGGLVMKGPAGFEIDRLDYRLGTPPQAVNLATARGFSASYQHVVEEVPMSDSQQGGDVCPYVRADMVYFERERGGAVFSTGSVAWCGALSQNDYDNPVSRITENVVRRFSDTPDRGQEPPNGGVKKSANAG